MTIKFKVSNLPSTAKSWIPWFVGTGDNGRGPTVNKTLAADAVGEIDVTGFTLTSAVPLKIFWYTLAVGSSIASAAGAKDFSETIADGKTYIMDYSAGTVTEYNDPFAGMNEMLPMMMSMMVVVMMMKMMGEMDLGGMDLGGGSSKSSSKSKSKSKSKKKNKRTKYMTESEYADYKASKGITMTEADYIEYMRGASLVPYQPPLVFDPFTNQYKPAHPVQQPPQPQQQMPQNVAPQIIVHY